MKRGMFKGEFLVVPNQGARHPIWNKSVASQLKHSLSEWGVAATLE